MKDSISSNFQLVLAGNPNSGKSTIFNQLTGARQHVGNYPGVTVEKKEGRCSFAGREFQVVDLPGQYSMEAHSEDEVAAREFLLANRNKKMILVNVVDASNFERNLFLSLQLRELGVPTILVLNMLDLARQRGYEFRNGEISEWLRLPVLECVGYTGQGVKDILAKATEIADQIENGKFTQSGPEWLNALAEEVFSEKLEETEKATRYYDTISRQLPTLVECESRRGSVKPSILDRLFLHRYLGLPLFFLMLYLIFQLTFTIGEYPMGWIESGVEVVSEKLGNLWPDGSESLLKSLILDGIVAGVGGVIVFLPNIVLLFFAISVLEDSGYMARVAVLMDRFMAKIGLHGKSFIPMLIGFGCSVPAIMGTRTLENRRERLATMFVIPLMSCGARMPIYALLIPAFFPTAWQGTVLWGIYVLGIALAIFLAKILSLTVLKGEPIPFIMELPPWHVPTIRTVGFKTCERGWLYLKKAGTVILGISIVLWALTTFPRLPEGDAVVENTINTASVMVNENVTEYLTGNPVENVSE
ncbi:MAG: ferrous iron transport protein B, partial [Planctomycetia bacterium]|nr:ferrous iron transport protein B [Planctomycetia bacterium]